MVYAVGVLVSLVPFFLAAPPHHFCPFRSLDYIIQRILHTQPLPPPILVYPLGPRSWRLPGGDRLYIQDLVRFLVPSMSDLQQQYHAHLNPRPYCPTPRSIYIIVKNVIEGVLVVAPQVSSTSAAPLCPTGCASSFAPIQLQLPFPCPLFPYLFHSSAPFLRHGPRSPRAQRSGTLASSPPYPTQLYCTTICQVKCTASCARLHLHTQASLTLYRWPASRRIPHPMHIASTRLCRSCERVRVGADGRRGELKMRCRRSVSKDSSNSEHSMYGMATARPRQAVARTCFMSVLDSCMPCMNCLLSLRMYAEWFNEYSFLCCISSVRCVRLLL